MPVEPSDTTSWRRDLLAATGYFVVTRIGIVIFIWLCGQHYRCYGTRCTDRQFVPENFLLNGLFQWDAHQYRTIAEHGYVLGHGFDTTAPYFPGFPLAARIVGYLFDSALVGGILLNNVACVAAAFFLARLVRALDLDKAHNGDRVAREAILLWTAGPLTLFLSVYLSESLFGLAAILLYWSVVRRRTWVALLAGVVLCYTRVNGVLVVGSALLLLWERRRVAPANWRLYAAVGLGLAGFVAFLVEQKLAFGNSLQWLDAQRQWNRFLTWPWETVRDDWLGFPALDPRHRSVDRMYRTQELLASALLAPLLFMRKSLRLPRALWALGLAGWLLPLCSHSLISIARYQTTNVYLALAIPVFSIRFPALRPLIWWTFGLVLAWYASTYPFGVWAT